MKPWQKSQTQVVDRTVVRNPFEAPVPASEPSIAASFQCLFGPHKAEMLHRGTAYCRTCYDEKNRLGQLIN